LCNPFDRRIPRGDAGLLKELCRVCVLCYTRPMDKTIRKYTDLDEMRADEYRYWQSRPVHERVAAVSELTQEHYALKGAAPDRLLIAGHRMGRRNRDSTRGIRPA
jgi:hypothetical protein